MSRTWEMTQCTGRRKAMVHQRVNLLIDIPNWVLWSWSFTIDCLMHWKMKPWPILRLNRWHEMDAEVLRLLKSRYALETQYIETESYYKGAHLDFRQEWFGNDQSLNGRDWFIDWALSITSSLNLDSCLPYLFEDFLKIYDWRWIVMVL